MIGYVAKDSKNGRGTYKILLNVYLNLPYCILLIIDHTVFTYKLNV